MPGIVGLITKMPKERAQRELARMIARLRHETFYGTGMWSDSQLGVYVGWVTRNRNSPGMPLQDDSGDISLVFAGEDFTNAEVFSDTSNPPQQKYLTDLARTDVNFPDCLNGRFHGLLIDHREGTAKLFNDRFGMHRIYYHQSPEAFYFAAEAKAILEVRSELGELDSEALAEFIACKCSLENRTLFRHIKALPPSSAWTFQNGLLLERKCYFDPKQWEEQELVEFERYYQEFRDVFSGVLPRYFTGPEKIAMSMTGGLDTRMIMAWLKPAPQTLPCFTFGDGTRNRQPRDVTVAQELAKICHQAHEVIPVGREFLANFPYYAERTTYLSDGCVDPVFSPDVYLNDKAREIAPVRMTGNYGSEVLRRSVAFRPWRPTENLLHPDFAPEISKAWDAYDRISQCHPLTFALFRQAPWHHYGLLALEQTKVSVRSPYLDRELVKLVYRAPESAVSSNDVCMRLIREGDPAISSVLTDRGLNPQGPSFRAFVAHPVLEFLFKAEYAYDSGMPQWVARIDHALSPLRLQELFLGRHKFHHFRIWLRDELSGFVKEILLDHRTLSRPYFNAKRIVEIVDGHLRRGLNYSFEIQKLIAIELIHRIFVDGFSRSNSESISVEELAAASAATGRETLR